VEKSHWRFSNAEQTDICVQIGAFCNTKKCIKLHLFLSKSFPSASSNLFEMLNKFEKHHPSPICINTTACLNEKINKNKLWT
jgi:hypothetical protein